MGHVKETDNLGEVKVSGVKKLKRIFMKLNVDWVYMFQNKTQWQAVMKTVMKL
jgi:hypothetical protein